MSLIIRFGGVPIRVIIPPMLLAKAMGIRRRDGFMPALVARLTTIGSSNATVPVLLTKAPMVHVTNMTKISNLSSLFPAKRNICELTFLANPV